MFESRPHDQFGWGFYYINIDNPKLLKSREYHLKMIISHNHSQSFTTINYEERTICFDA